MYESMSNCDLLLQASEGWGRLSSQLYQNHWQTQEHSGWSDDDDHDPDMLQPHTGITLCMPKLSVITALLCHLKLPSALVGIATYHCACRSVSHQVLGKPPSQSRRHNCSN